MTYATCQAAMQSIWDEERRSGEYGGKWSVAFLEGIKDWCLLLQYGRENLNDLQGTEAQAARGEDECEVHMASLQRRIEQAQRATG